MLDLKGKKFGRLTVLRIAKLANHYFWWWCKCECGNIKSIRGSRIACGNTKSCGCIRREKSRIHCTQLGKSNFTHGATRGGKWTREYLTWFSMRQRCENPNHTKYLYYGGRGISVCERWQKFENFLMDMGPKPKGLTLDRHPNNDGNYEPGNCRWATWSEQMKNRRKWIKLKTHCRFGHLLDSKNLIVRKNGWRSCRTCRQKYRETHEYPKKRIGGRA
jgi:hypothetical protein